MRFSTPRKEVSEILQVFSSRRKSTQRTFKPGSDLTGCCSDFSRVSSMPRPVHNLAFEFRFCVRWSGTTPPGLASFAAVPRFSLVAEYLGVLTTGRVICWILVAFCAYNINPRCLKLIQVVAKAWSVKAPGIRAEQLSPLQHQVLNRGLDAEITRQHPFSI